MFRYTQVVAIVFIAVISAGCGEISDRPTASDAVAQMSALEQMAVAFEGGHSQQEIEPKVSLAMELYDVALTEDNYSRAGSTLMALRKSIGVSEMAILEHMICSHVDEVDLSFAEMAGFSAAFVKNGDSC